MADQFTTSDERNLLSQPGFFYFQDYGTSDPFTKAVFMNGATYQVTTEKVEIAFDDIGTVRDEVSTEMAELTMSAGQVLDLNLIQKLTGGLYTYSTIPGTLVSGAEDEITSGNWNYDKTILISNQNGDGSKPVINTVTGSVDGALVLNTDYFISDLPGAGWAVIILDSTTVTTEVQSITINYDYTPNEGSKLTRGGVKIIEPLTLAFQTTAQNQLDGSEEYVTFYFYKAFSNGNIGHGFSPENSAEPITMDLGFTVKRDTNRPVTDQLYQVYRGGESLG